MTAAFEAFALGEVRERQRASGKQSLEFLRRDDMSAGIYVLAKGANDTQSPHTEDELYYVISGRARFKAGDADREVSPGDTLFVAAELPHRFHSIEEDLVLLVVFAPAKGTRART